MHAYYYYKRLIRLTLQLPLCVLQPPFTLFAGVFVFHAIGKSVYLN